MLGEKRMFSRKITESDAFLDMSASTQALYFHLGMNADDEGVVSAPKKVMRMIGAAEDDLRVLIAKKFLLLFDGGVIVVKHWRINNSLRQDRIQPTEYEEIRDQLYVKPNGAYTLDPAKGVPLLEIKRSTDNQLTTTCQPSDNQVTVKWTAIKEKKIKENKTKEGERRFTPPSLQEVTDYCNQRGNNVDPERFVNFYQSKNWMVGKNKMKDWKAAIITWEKRDQDRAKGKRTQTDEEFEEELRRFMENDES